MPDEERKERCDGCRFYGHTTDGPAGANVGECHRFPPQVGATGPHRFPEVFEHEWCGEFQTQGPSAAVLAPPVDELGLSVRARKGLRRLGCVTLGDVIKHTANDLLMLKNFGPYSLDEVREKLAKRGLALAGDAPAAN